MSHRHAYTTLATYDGYCNGCDDDRPLVLMEHGPRGLRAWLAGVGAEDRALTYTCLVCGRVEHVPHTEAEDDEYAATLPTWPDWSPVAEPVAAAAPVIVLPGDVFALAAARVQGAPKAVALRPPLVRVITLPVQRVSATDEHLLSFSA